MVMAFMVEGRAMVCVGTVLFLSGLEKKMSMYVVEKCSECLEALLRHCIGEKWRERCHHAGLDY